jgi:hypothetical protein
MTGIITHICISIVPEISIPYPWEKLGMLSANHRGKIRFRERAEKGQIY